MTEQEIEALKAENQKLKLIIEHLLPDNSGRYFICGGSTELNKDGLPETILVCPHPGLDGMAAYTLTTPYSAPGW